MKNTIKTTLSIIILGFFAHNLAAARPEKVVSENIQYFVDLLRQQQQSKASILDELDLQIDYFEDSAVESNEFRLAATGDLDPCYCLSHEGRAFTWAECIEIRDKLLAVKILIQLLCP